jgi:phosphoribosylformimino-5-aminoimidazole carboxamide ribotide isomerase
MRRAPAAGSCAEFLVHGVDVEGMQLGVDEELIRLLGRASPLPVTYAGGVRSLVCAGAPPCPACVGTTAAA